MKFAQRKNYLFIPLFLLIFSFKLKAQTVTYQDNFSTQDYDRNDGTANWSSNWIETNDDGAPATGDTFIFNGLGGVLAFVGDGANNNGGHGINRTLDLSGATAATLSFDWTTQGLDTFGGGVQEELGIFISNDNGVNFTQIGNGTITGNNTDSFSQDISAFISANTVFRLQVIGGNEIFEGGEFAFIDNLVIEADFPSLVVVEDQTVNEDIGVTTVTVRIVGNPTIGGFSVDYNTIDNSAFSDSDYTEASGTLNFIGIPNETRTFTIPIIDNTFQENDELFFIQLSNVSNPLIVTANGSITIIDDVGDIAVPIDEPLLILEQFNGNIDYTSTGGTFRDDPINTCSVTSTSSNIITSDVTTNGTVIRAFLIWTHSGSNADDVVFFENQRVEADLVNRADFGDATGRQFHSMLSDVTNIVAPIANLNTNDFDVTGLSIDNTGAHCANNTTTGGWSLFIFFEDPILPASSINFYHGFDAQFESSTSYTLDNFFAIGSDDAKTTVLSWEGDDGLGTGELLTVTTSSGENTLNGDGSNTGGVSNPYNSTIFDNSDDSIVNTSNTFGIDLDTFDISPFVSLGDSSATTNVQVGNDFVILNAVLLKVPSNLIIGTIFEDINYGGGLGRDRATASGVDIPNVSIELYREEPTGSGNFVIEDIETTSATGEFTFGGIPNGNYQVRVVNSTIVSSRGGGNSCTTCLPVQTFKTDYDTTTSTFTPVFNAIGGNNPQAEDTAAGVILGAQSTANISLLNEGVVGVDFGFNFNTIVNTNTDGQGSLEQFIINSNNLDEGGLNIDPHSNDSSLDPDFGDDTSIFNIPTTDTAFIAADGYFDIFLDAGNLPSITSDNTKIDGRTQTAFTGNTNNGTIGAGGTTVGTTSTTLPLYELPEIQIRKNNASGFSLAIDANNVTVRNIAVNGNNNAYDGIRIASGNNVIVTENIIGIIANGVDPLTNDRHGIRINGGESLIERNYISGFRNNGIRINGGTLSTTIQNNHLEANGVAECDANIEAQGGATGVVIQNNLINNAGNYGIDNINSVAITINQNTISNTGALSTNCNNQNGIRILTGNSSITNNIINNNGRAGVTILGGSTENLISQNSIFSNGIFEPSLGIDIDNNGVNLNDLNDTDGGPNERFNFPIIETASIRGNSLIVSGWARPDAIIEIFISDLNNSITNPGDNAIGAGITLDYGEGQTFLGTVIEGVNDSDNSVSSYNDVDGNTDTTNRFRFVINIPPGLLIGNYITATATNSNTNSTSEFGPVTEVRQATVITNRRITHRATGN